MSSLIEELDALERRALAELAEAREAEALEQWRIVYQGRRQGLLPKLLEQLPSLSIADRRAAGARGNQVRQALETAFAERKEALGRAATERRLAEEAADVTLPGRPTPTGRYHPTTQVIREVCAIFAALGYQVVEGPEVEWDYYNFEALNIPVDHPARDRWDTLWTDYETENGDRPLLLRTHTSPMQVRVMEKQQPPVRVLVPGRVYRHEATDATHESMFYQIEGLAVDTGITFADLRGTLYAFARRMFGADRRIRFRCDYFPFVEPGVDMSIDCFICGGKNPSCRVCRGSGWLEIMGAGMVHPEVIRRVGYDPEVYTGFAFGMGPERIAMLRYGIDDIRHFYANDLRFLEQF
jgi:phenylalanyl-tRNA synthetase alpha chain